MLAILHALDDPWASLAVLALGGMLAGLLALAITINDTPRHGR